MRHARQQIGGRRRDDDEIGLARQLDVAHLGLVGQAEQIVANGLAAQRRGRQRRDEMLGRRRHHDAYVAAALAQPADEFERLVGRDAAADDQQNAGADSGVSVM